MSTCPSKDIHSVYLDNEMPEKYKLEYEAHLSSCPKCQAELQKIKSLQSMLRQDSAEVTPDSHYLEGSFERLNLKMNYSKNTGRHENKSFGGFKYIAPAMAAAAVFALVLPFGLKNNKVPVTANTAAVASVNSNYSNIPVASNVSFGSGNGRVISGNIQESVLPSSARGVNRNHDVARQMIKDVGVFHPVFDEGKTISIRITVPGMNTVPVSTEIELPVNLVTGQY